MRFPENLKYTKDHEWAKIDGKHVVIGVTDHAQRALGDVVFVELPAVGRMLKQGEAFGVVESIKAVSDLYAPMAGKVTEVNSDLTDNPAQVNQDPQGGAWMIKLEMTEPAAEGSLMDASAYAKYVETLK